MAKQNGMSFPDAVYNYHHAPRLSEGCTACDAPSCEPVGCRQAEDSASYRICCDENGCCCLYPAACRNRFWPEFSHPRWLCCKDLYDGGSEGCGEEETTAE